MEKLFTMLTVVALAAFTVGCGDAGEGADDSGTTGIEGGSSIDGTPISDEILTLPDDEAKPDAKGGGGASDGPPAKKGGN